MAAISAATRSPICFKRGRSSPWTSTSIGVRAENSTGRVTRASRSGTRARRARMRSITPSSTAGSELSSSILKRAECSPSSERCELAASKPTDRIRLSMCSRSARIAASTGARISSVSSSGVPTGSATSKVISPWWTSGSSSEPRPRAAIQVTASTAATISSTAAGRASAQRITRG